MIILVETVSLITHNKNKGLAAVRQCLLYLTSTTTTGYFLEKGTSLKQCLFVLIKT